jgi:stearoyl-CoA desaturase (delta-9 desaturase)
VARILDRQADTRVDAAGDPADGPTGRSPSPASTPEAPPRPRSEQLITALVVFGPLAGVVLAVIGLFGHGVTSLDLILGVVFFIVTGHGLSAGFHRLFTHRSYRAARGVRIAMAVAGSLALEGSVVSWVANHRRHHAYTDRTGDPHSPYQYGTGTWALIRGAVHAHVGWLFEPQNNDMARWAPDVARDPDLMLISRLFPVLALISLALPAGIGWLVSGTAAGAWGGLLWGGLVRVFLLHQATFAVNSACHIWGRRPFVTRDADRATNFAPLAILAMGDNWHNLHHSCPTLARHGVERGQLDSTARLIWLLERAGVVSDVRWPDPARLDLRRREHAPSSS